MNRSGLAVVTGIILAVLFILGAVYLGREVLGIFSDLEGRFLAFSLLVVIAALIVASGLRRSGEGAERTLRLQQKVEAYFSYLKSIRDCDALSGATARALALWANPRVLRVIDARPDDNGTDAAFRDWLVWLLREMRQDLGQSNIQLKLESIIDDVLSGSGSGGDDGYKLG